MSWTASRNGKSVDVSGPVGDTLKITVTSNDTAFTWTGWSWTGAVKTAPGGTNVVSFSFTDTSSASVLNLVATASTASGFTAGDTMVYGIQGTKGGETYTFVSGKVLPTPEII